MINVRRKDSDKKKKINMFVIKCEEKDEKEFGIIWIFLFEIEWKLLYLMKKNVNFYRWKGDIW